MHVPEAHDAWRLKGSRPAAVEPVDMMPSRLSSKRPDLMNKDAEHASLKLDLAAETDEKWTLASGDNKHDAGDARAREKRANLCILKSRELNPRRCRRYHRDHHAPARKSALGGDRQVQQILVGGADGERMPTHATMPNVQRGVE